LSHNYLFNEHIIILILYSIIKSHKKCLFISEIIANCHIFANFIAYESICKCQLIRNMALIEHF